VGGLPEEAALGFGERAAAAGAGAGQVGLFGVQVLGQDDLLPLVSEECGEGSGFGGGFGPAGAEGALVGDDGGVLGRVRVPGEGGDRLVDGALDGLVELTLR
jgi:hypothetical protein